MCKIKGAVFCIIILMILVGCATPGQQARARRINAETDQAQDWHELRLAEAQETSPERVAANRLYIWLGVTLAVGFGFTSLIAYSVYTIGTAQAVVSKARLEAQLVYLDPATHHFPLRYFEVKGRLFAQNPNTGQVKKLELEAHPSPMLTAGSQRAQIASIIKSEPLLLEGSFHETNPEL